jgi:TPP-dependent pyruvate/acetoin dehydrogenase alpha subunit
MLIDKKLATALYSRMQLIRRVEEGIALRYPDGKMRCPTHLSIGQEASATAVGLSLGPQDLALSTHRAHAHYLAKGGDIRAMLSEIYGKVTGCCRGRGGSMHLQDKAVGFMGSTAIVGNSIPIGVGLALGLRLKGLKNVSVVFFGDGCTEEGAFYESVNFAVVRNLPVLFVCENNFYSVYSPLSVRQPESRKIYKMVESMGLATSIVDGNDIEASYSAVQTSLRHLRSGLGPYFIELTTYRWLEHCGPNFDNHIGYRSQEEFESWKLKDPIKSYQEKLIERGWLTPADIKKLNSDIEIVVEDAFSYAETSDFPPETEAYTDLYASSLEAHA